MTTPAPADGRNAEAPRAMPASLAERLADLLAAAVVCDIRAQLAADGGEPCRRDPHVTIERRPTP
jgi:hypothetical protein